MQKRVTLLVEDDHRDETLILRALEKGNIINDVIVARDGVEGLDYFFGKGMYTGRDNNRHAAAHAAGLEIAEGGRSRGSEKDSSR